MLYDHNVSLLRSMLDQAAGGGANRTANEQKTGDYYSSCINAQEIDKRDLAALQPELDRIAALQSKEELPALMAHFELMNVTAFFDFGEQQDFKEAKADCGCGPGRSRSSGMRLLSAGRPGDQKIRQHYVEHIYEHAEAFGLAGCTSFPDAHTIMDLETALAKVSLDVTSQRNPNKIYHMMPVDDLAKLAPAFSWKTMLADTGAPPVAELNVTYPEFFTGLNALPRPLASKP
jgi:putative endopeptidase